MISINFEASNKTDWIIYVEATDLETGADLDFTGASISVMIKDNGCTLLTASTGNGQVALPTTGTIQVQFTDANMKTLCAGTYHIGCVYSLNSETTQLFTGSVSVYDGIASL